VALPVSYKLPSVNLKHGPATTAPRGSLHPFRSEQSLNPYTDYYRPSFAFSAFSYPLLQQLASRLACHRSSAPNLWRRIGLTTFPFLPNPIRLNFEDRIGNYPFSARLFPGSICDDVLPIRTGATRCTPSLVRACQPLWPVSNHEVYRRFTSVAHAEFALPPRHIAARSVVTPSPVGDALRRVHCSQSFAPDRYQSRASR
jgi:hypothetical protein